MKAGPGLFDRVKKRLIIDISPTDAISNVRKRRFVMLVSELGSEARCLFNGEEALENHETRHGHANKDRFKSIKAGHFWSLRQSK